MCKSGFESECPTPRLVRYRRCAPCTDRFRSRFPPRRRLRASPPRRVMLPPRRFFCPLPRFSGSPLPFLPPLRSRCAVPREIAPTAQNAPPRRFGGRSVALATFSKDSLENPFFCSLVEKVGGGGFTAFGFALRATPLRSRVRRTCSALSARTVALSAGGSCSASSSTARRLGVRGVRALRSSVYRQSLRGALAAQAGPPTLKKHHTRKCSAYLLSANRRQDPRRQ